MSGVVWGVYNMPALSAHGVCYTLTAKKPMHDWFYFATPPPTVTCEKVKANRKKAKDTMLELINSFYENLLRYVDS